ncbi:MAG: PAS domain-containing protein [Gemmatimonadales bacterium]|nr:PAS domain-containing protein [Gemmatimonadales bacterium]
MRSVARLLNGGFDADTTVTAVTRMLHIGLRADHIVLELRESGARPPRRIGSAAPPVSAAGSSGAILIRVPLAHEGLGLGVLEAAFASDPEVPEPDRGTEREVLDTVADLLAPFLSSLELSADLASEVAVQSREMEDQRRFTGLVIDTLPLGLYIVDRQYRIVIWNRKRETGTQGLRRDAVVGRPVFDVLTRQPAAQLRAEFDRVFSTGEIQQSEQAVVQAGKTRYYRLNKIPMRLDGETITHVITIGEDVTEWRAVQGQIMQAEKLGAVGQLAAGVMHEINNPLATIGACGAAIQVHVDQLPLRLRAQVDEYLEIIEREVQRCGRIVDGLLDFSRSKPVAKAAVPLNALADETLFLLKHHHRFRRINVERSFHASAPATIGSGDRLTQVLMSLLLNAADAVADDGTVIVRTYPSPGRDGEVVLEVEDNGVGIALADQSRLFDPFYTTKPAGRGTGLGLSICYGIVEEHRGRIEVESEPGRGAIFRLFLPGAS